MTADGDDAARKVARLERRLERERRARAEAEAIGHDAAREIARLRDATIELNRFAAVVAHDLRTPLAGARGLVDVALLRYGDDFRPEVRELLERSIGAHDRMNELIQHLLVYARSESQALEISEFSADEVAQWVIDGIERDAKIDVQDLPVIRTDRVLFDQVLSNLMRNAVKYVPEDREAHVVLSCARESDAWRFTVTDNGPGVPPEERISIFEPFHRIARDDEGSGLGLAICKRSVVRLGGDIWVTERPEGGSHFRFTVPLEPPEELSEA